MNIQNARLVITAGAEKQFPKEQLPEIAFAGKSNVGKSSLINALLGRNGLARTSSAPGKTRTVNFYEVDGTLMLVDLPGYGYAKVSREEQQKWGKVIEHYMNTRSTLKLVLLLVDIRHDPTADDIMMYEWLAYYHVPMAVIATKSDKISRGAAASSVLNIRKKLGAQAEVPVIPFSAETKTGKDELWQMILSSTEKPENSNGKSTD